MRVCPLCEFIYEDDQGVCDMDGAALVYDPAPLALAQVSASSGPTHAKSRLKRFATTAVTGVALGTVLVLVFYAFMLRKQEQFWADAPRAANNTSPQVTSASGVPPILDLSLPVPLALPVTALPIPSPTIDQTPAPSVVPPSPTHGPKAGSGFLPDPTARGTAGGFTGPRAPSATTVTGRRLTSSSRQTTTRLEESARKSERAAVAPVERHRNETKIGSFLRKTGRILKKPFS